MKETWNNLLLTFDSKKEQWFFIPNYSLYLISTFGKVKNIRTEKNLKATKNDSGYYYVKLYNEKGQKSKLVHRLVMETLGLRQYFEYEVNHKDFNKANNSLSNLEWVTRDENLKHYRDSKPSYNKGSQIHNSKLKESDVLNILSNKEKNMSQLAKDYKVSVTTISYILMGKTWKHVPRKAL